jgi:hypothetical protein
MGQSLAQPSAAPACAAERLLADEVARALRAPAGRVAVALHLSRLRAPAPRPHHTRVARALLQDIALRHGGQVFAMRNGDIVLLCAGADEGGVASPVTLPAALGRLFGADAPELGKLTSLWRLGDEGEGLLAYAAERQAEPAPWVSAGAGAGPGTGLGAGEASGGDGVGHGYGFAVVEAVDGLIDAVAIEDVVVLQTAVRVRGQGAAGRAGPLPLAARMVPAFRDMSFSLAAVSARADVRQAIADPFLAQHFAARLDARMLSYMHEYLLSGGRLSRPALTGGLPIHLNVSLEAIVSVAFGRLCEAALARGVRFGIEISLIEAAADMTLMAYARKLLAHNGFPLVLGGLDAVALTMTHPGALQPDMVKLVWSARLADADASARTAIEAGIARIGAGRIVLQRADTEAALLWGQRVGIECYQGFFLDAVMAARRVAVCHSGRHCTLRQCLTRAGTMKAEVRTGCGNPALLEMSVDPAAAAA